MGQAPQLGYAAGDQGLVPTEVIASHAIACEEKHVARLMRQEKLRIVRSKKRPRYRVVMPATTAPNRLQREITVAHTTRPARVSFGLRRRKPGLGIVPVQQHLEHVLVARWRQHVMSGRLVSIPEIQTDDLTDSNRRNPGNCKCDLSSRRQ